MQLTRPLRVGGRELKTIADAGRFITDELPPRFQARAWWTYAAELLMRAAESGEHADVEEATLQVMRALGREGLLER